MKRIISLFILLAMLVSTLAVAAFADGTDETTTTEEQQPSVTPGYRVPQAALYDENLIAYYNFLGDTAEEQFADKAPNGSVDDAMIPNGDVTVADGKAVISNAKGSYLSIPVDGDFSDLAGKTLYVTYVANRVSKPNNYANDLISMNTGNTFRYYVAATSTATSYPLSGKLGGTNYKVDADTPGCPAADWYYVAVTFDKAEDGTMTAVIYNSANGVDYVPTTVTEAGYGDKSLLKTALLGKTHETVDDRGIQMIVGEVRVYSDVLTAAEVRNLSYITPGTATTQLPPEDGTTTEPDTPVVPDVPRPDRLPVAALYDENLVAYYDFEGDSDAVKAMDKAPAGSVYDDMIFSDVVVNNGVAYVKSAQGSYLAIAKSDDTTDLNGKTFYMVFNATGVAGTYSNDIISVSGTYRYWLNKGSGDDNFQFGGGIGAKPTTTGYKLTTNKNVPIAPAETWYYIAITFELTENELVITAYNSADGLSYVSTIDAFQGEFKPADLNRTADILIGKATKTVGDRGISYYVDELRIYNKVLTADEIAKLVYTKPGTTTVIPETPTDPDNTTEDSNVTTEPQPPVTTEPVGSTTEAQQTTEKPATTTAKPTTTTESAPKDTTEPTTTTGADDTATSGGCKGAVITPFAIIATAMMAMAVVTRKNGKDE